VFTNKSPDLLKGLRGCTAGECSAEPLKHVGHVLEHGHLHLHAVLTGTRSELFAFVAERFHTANLCWCWREEREEEGYVE
jgi:hypothetical protein